MSDIPVYQRYKLNAEDAEVTKQTWLVTFGIRYFPPSKTFFYSELFRVKPKQFSFVHYS